MKCRRSYRDDEKFKEYRNAYKRRYRAKRDFNHERFRKWTEKEIQVVMDRQKTDTEIAREIKRSIQAVQIKRHRILKQREKA